MDIIKTIIIMATVLNKNLLRESTEKFDDREIMVTLTDDQKISMKLKGLKSGEESIGILELFKQMKGVTGEESETKPEGPVSVSNAPKPKSNGKGQMVDLYEFLQQLRTSNATAWMDVETMSKFDGVIKDAIDRYTDHKK